MGSKEKMKKQAALENFKTFLEVYAPPVITTDMDEVLVDLSVPIYDYLKDNPHIFGKDYDLDTNYTRDELYDRDIVFINEWLRRKDVPYNRMLNLKIVDFIGELDYSELEPTEMCKALIEYSRNPKCKEIHVLTSCVCQNQITNKLHWLVDNFKAGSAKIRLHPVTYELGNHQSKSEVWNSLEIDDMGLFIDDDLKNIIDMVVNTNISKEIAKKMFLMPDYKFNHMDKELQNHHAEKYSSYFAWYNHINLDITRGAIVLGGGA